MLSGGGRTSSHQVLVQTDAVAQYALDHDSTFGCTVLENVRD